MSKASWAAEVRALRGHDDRRSEARAHRGGALDDRARPGYSKVAANSTSIRLYGEVFGSYKEETLVEEHVRVFTATWRTSSPRATSTPHGRVRPREDGARHANRERHALRVHGSRNHELAATAWRTRRPRSRSRPADALDAHRDGSRYRREAGRPRARALRVLRRALQFLLHARRPHALPGRSEEGAALQLLPQYRGR
jgi:hypothetical protein